MALWLWTPTKSKPNKVPSESVAILAPLNDSLCSGSLGENIFTDGDFGSGTENVKPNPGNLAPGYQYQTSPPPNDGFFTITNNTTGWPSFAQFWIDIEDNSNDPNGYMMVVNASFSPGIFYENTIDNLCEGTLYEFSADIINMNNPNRTGNILPNVAFLLDDEVQFSTGDVPRDAKWYTYGFSFVTEPNQTSLKLAIRNNAPGGGGNDLALDNITFRACGPEVVVNATGVICEDEEVVITATIIGDVYDDPHYQWQRSSNEGASWENVPGAGNDSSYFITDPRDRNLYRLLMANAPDQLLNPKCRVISTVERLRVVARFHEFDQVICRGDALQVGNSTYTEPGTYVDPLISPDGCDSIVTTNLTVIEEIPVEPVINTTNPFCPGEASGSITIDSILGDFDYGFLYSLDGSPLQEEPQFTSLTSGTYNLFIQDELGCNSYEGSVSLIESDPIFVQLPEDIIIELGDSIPLRAIVSQPVSIVEWTPQELISCTNCLDPVIKPLDNTTISVLVYNSAECTASDEINITVEKNRPVFIPNVFSPNGDGINDFFQIFPGGSVREVLDLEIYDRWGGLVYDQDSGDPQGWNGLLNGEPAMQGVYVYIVKVVFIDKVEEILSGDLLLLR